LVLMETFAPHILHGEISSILFAFKIRYDCQSRCFDISCYQPKKFIKFCF
jgi:hypothetical protein